MCSISAGLLQENNERKTNLCLKHRKKSRKWRKAVETWKFAETLISRSRETFTLIKEQLFQAIINERIIYERQTSFSSLAANSKSRFQSSLSARCFYNRWHQSSSLVDLNSNEIISLLLWLFYPLLEACLKVVRPLITWGSNQQKSERTSTAKNVKNILMFFM